ncbi:MAG: MraY family glycosyltransferase [Clostridia bacterium]|nr:MraY family glycosyltransferase [Clostridia bacterium]
MWGDIAIEFLLAFVTTFVFTPYSIRLAMKIGAIDVPRDERRMHKKDMPKLGGLAVIIGFIIASVYLIFVKIIQNELDLFTSEGYGYKLLGVALGILILSIVCFFDDKQKDIKPLTKLAGQSVAAIIVICFGIKIDFINLPFLAQNVLLDNVISNIVTFCWIVGITNAINLIDGLDGLSTGISIISCLSLLIIFSLNASPLIAIVLVTALLGALVGFLPYNFNPAKTFIGEMGTNFIGFTISIISILGVAKTATAFVVVLPIIVLGLPILDTVFAIIRRLIKGKSLKAVVQADKGHLHHKLVEKGYSPKDAVLVLYGISVSFGMFAIILFESGIWKALSFALMLLAVIAIGYREIKTRGKQ